MKILITSDLHNRHDWYNWLLYANVGHDAIAIAGDLIDMRFDTAPQVAFVTHWMNRATATGKKLFLCEGNHDVSGTSFGELNWMESIGMTLGVITVGRSEMVHTTDGCPTIITTCRYAPASAVPNEELFQTGFKLRQAEPDSKWIVLHHEPPRGLLGDKFSASPYLPQWITDYAPDYVVCGHDHSTPLKNGFCTERRGRTLVINPGQRFVDNEFRLPRGDIFS